MDFEPIDDRRCRLGESPYWWVERRQLLFVDVHGGDVHTYRADGTGTSHHVSERVAFVLPAADGSVVLGLRNGLGGLSDLDAATGDLGPAVPIEADVVATALNDARSDRAGRLWFGTMDRQDRTAIGGLYRWVPTSGVSRQVEGVALANGIQFSPAGDIMYFVDSWTQRLDAFEYDQATGDLGRRWTVAEVDPDDGMPDGINIDAQGRIYVALYGAAAIRRYLPDGELDTVIDVPVQYPTSCTFGGDDFRTLYVTSAAAGQTGTGHFKGKPRPARHASGFDGAVLAADIDVPGFESPVAAGNPSQNNAA